MPKYLDRKEAAEYLRAQGIPCTGNSLQKFASTGGGPTYAIFGRKALYTREWLDAWREEKMSAPRRSTSEAA